MKSTRALAITEIALGCCGDCDVLLIAGLPRTLAIAQVALASTKIPDTLLASGLWQGEFAAHRRYNDRHNVGGRAAVLFPCNLRCW